MPSRYEVLRPLESGRDVRVYLVSDRWESGREKVLTLFHFDTSKEQDRFDLEKLYTFRRSLDHPLLIRLEDLAFRGRQVGIITPLLSETPIRDSFPATWEERTRLAVQLAELLTYLHHRKFYWGYLTPSQVFVNPEQQLLVNVLFPRRDSSRDSTKGEAIRYMAPEYLECGIATEKTDLYSLGMVLYHLFTGSAPYAEEDVHKLKQKQLLTDPPRPRNLNPDIPAAVEDLILDLIQKRAELRPQSIEYVEEFLKDQFAPCGSAVPRFRSVLLGREKELITFRSILDEYLRCPKTQFIAISGPSGIGKTALMEYFEMVAKIRSVTTYAINHHSQGVTTDAFRNLIIALASLVEPGDESCLGAHERRKDQQTFTETVVGALRQFSSGCPLVLCLNDLQWMDEASFELFRRVLLVERLPILVLGNYRTDEPPHHWAQLKSQLAQNSILIELGLNELKDLEVRQLVVTLLGKKPARDLSEGIVRLCAGNPFYVYEFLRSRQERGELIFSAGRWRWRALAESQTNVPETVTQSIRGRLAALDEKELHFLKYLAILDKPATIDLLSQATSMTVSDVFDSIRLLDRLDLVSLRGNLDHPLVAIGHDWIARGIRNLIDKEERGNIHRVIAKALELDYETTEDVFLLVPLTRHFSNGGETAKVEQYIWQAIDFLERDRLYKDAAQLIDDAVQTKIRLATNVEQFRKMIDLFYLSGQFEKCLSLCHEVLTGDLELQAEDRASILSLVGGIQANIGRLADSFRILQEALSLSNAIQSPKLSLEIQGQLVFTLVRMGRLSEAGRVVNKIKQSLPTDDRMPGVDKVYFALSLYEWHRGYPKKALDWNTKSMESVLIADKYIRFAGRCANSASFCLDEGNFALAQKFIHYTRRVARETGNTELRIFSRLRSCLFERKQGQHRRALESLEEILALNSHANRNQQVEAEVYLECAKNLNYQFFPERALCWIEKRKQVPVEREDEFSRIEATLTFGWSLLLLGRASDVIELTSEIDWRRLSRKRGCFFILRSQAYLARGDLERAWRNLCRAWCNTPEELNYQRVRLKLLKGELSLWKGDFLKADCFIRTGLSVANQEFYLPLIVEGYGLRAKWCLAVGEKNLARVNCLRALQFVSKIDRPGLRADMCCTLGRIQAVLGRADKAIQNYTQALQIYKERLLHLSPEYRNSFAARFIAPVEAERDKLFSDSLNVPPRYLLRLYHFTSAAKDVHDEKELAKTIIEVVGRSMPKVPANLLLRQSPGGSLQLVASRGHCSRTGNHILSKLDGNEEIVRDGEGGVGIPFRWHGNVFGLLYLEHNGYRISEADLDFLRCLGSVVEMQLMNYFLGKQVSDYKPVATAISDRNMVGIHSSIQRLLTEVGRVALTNATVLITGESGTGKELVARAIHDQSARRHKNFVPINCAAMPAELIESELFGHVRGSFTGAQSDKKGLFEVASGGTIFLDEIGSMPLPLQSRLLRVLQDRKIRRIGETAERTVDIRIVAATNQPLADLVRQQQFREDLYHRLNVCHLQIPPLRERLTDVPLLVSHFLDQLNRREGANRQISPDALTLLSNYSFPGNVRELGNIIESAYHLCADNTISSKNISSRIEGDASDCSHSRSRAQSIVDDLVAGRVDFWTAVRQPYLEHDLSRSEVQEIISMGLAACGGRYRKLLEHFNMPAADYKKFVSFLTSQKCKVDFRPYRKATVTVGGEGPKKLVRR